MITTVDEATPVDKQTVAVKKSARKGAAPKSATTSKASPAKKSSGQVSETVAAVPEKSTGKSVKVKSVRDTFSMPAADYALISSLKIAASDVGLKVKKSELLRAGLQLLSKLEATELKTLLADTQTKKA